MPEESDAVDQEWPETQEEEKGESSESVWLEKISEPGAASIMKLLWQRGYCHASSPGAAPVNSSPGAPKEKALILALAPQSGELSSNNPSTWVTVSFLEGQLEEQLLSRRQGRWHRPDVLAWMAETYPLQSAGGGPSATLLTEVWLDQWWQRRLAHSTPHPPLEEEAATRSPTPLVGWASALERQQILLTWTHVSQVLAPQLIQTVAASTTPCSVTDLASTVFRLSVESTRSLLASLITSTTTSSSSSGEELMWWPSADSPHSIDPSSRHPLSRWVSTRSGWTCWQQKVREQLAALTEPVVLTEWIHQHEGWDEAWIRPLLLQDPDPGSLWSSAGELRGRDWVPTLYKQQQRRALLELYHTTGWVTQSQAQALTLSVAEMKDLIQADHQAHLAATTETFTAPCLLKHCILHPDVLLSPLEIALQDAAAAGTWVDVGSWLPKELWTWTDDVQTLLTDLVRSIDASGWVVVGRDNALYASSAWVQTLPALILPPLIERLAQAKAAQLDALQHPSKTGKSKKSKAIAYDEDEVDDAEEAFIPPLELARAVLTQIPELSSLGGDGYRPDDPHSGPIEPDSVLVKFCAEALDLEPWRKTWQVAVQAEYQRLQSLRQSASSAAPLESATVAATMEVAFEDPTCFARACYMVQMATKFLHYASSGAEIMGHVTKEAMVKSLLRGIGSEFTRRITEYSLFKNHVEKGLFALELAGQEGRSWPSYCSPFDLVARDYPPVFLAVQAAPEGRTYGDPLQLLRTVLPGHAGNALAQLWMLLGEDCYSGPRPDGSQQINMAESYDASDEGGTASPASAMDDFLTHVEDHCLTICGLPFKKLDKKAEKNLLADRRQVLVQQLERIREPGDVLELTIMVLFQQVKNQVVTFSLTQGDRPLLPPVLTLLTRERKISQPVAQVLQRLADCLQQGQPADLATVERVRACGLCRDIAKHTVT